MTPPSQFLQGHLNSSLSKSLVSFKFFPNQDANRFAEFRSLFLEAYISFYIDAEIYILCKLHLYLSKKDRPAFKNRNVYFNVFWPGPRIIIRGWCIMVNDAENFNDWADRSYVLRLTSSRVFSAASEIASGAVSETSKISPASYSSNSSV